MRKTGNQVLSRPRAFTADRRFIYACILLVGLVLAFPAECAEIYINRTGTPQLDFTDLTDGSMNNLQNDAIPEFNTYLSRWDIANPIEWTHTWSLANPSDGAHALDADEVYTVMITSELFPVIWDIDYPVSDEHDPLYWDSVPYAGGGGAAFDIALNPGAVNLGYVQGNNNYWGAKRLTLDPALLFPAGDTEYFWLNIDEDPGGVNWLTSIDYSDLAIIFNWGDLTINKTTSGISGFNPPRVGYTTTYTVRIDVSNNTTTASGGPMHDVVVTDNFPPGSTIVTAPSLGAAAIDAAGNLTWTIGKLEDGAANVPPAAGSSDYMEVQVAVTPTQAQVGSTILLNAGATINGKQVPQDPGDGTGTLYPFNFYSDPQNDLSSVSAAVSTAAAAAANTGIIVTTATIVPGDNISVTVTDSDLNANAAAVETVTVTLVNQATGESESVICTETGVNTGIFTATLTTVFGMAAGVDNTGDMNVKAGDTVRGTYNDLVAATGNPAVATDDTTVNGGDDGTISSTTPINPGNNVTITVTDADLNTNPAAADTFQLSTTNSRTGETELLTYTETGVNTGIFTATLPTAFGVAAGANNSGSMNCISGDVLSTQYADALTAIGNTATVTASTNVIGGSDGTLVLTANIIPGDNITVTITDSDLNTNPAVAQTISLTLTHSRTGETETVTLTESGANTGLFTTTVPTVFGSAAGANNNGTFTVRAGDVISGTYSDALTGLGGTATVTDSTTVNGGADGSISSTPQIFPGNTVTFTITDADLNTDTGAAEIYVYTITCPGTGESENVQLTETGVNSGIFTGTIATAFGLAGGADNDGSFTVRAGLSLVFTYNDALTAIGGTNTETTVTSVLGGTTGMLTSTATTPAGNPLTVTLTDADLNANTVAVDTVNVAAVNNITGETETITLTETGLNTGVFTASVTTLYRTGAAPNNDGEFYTIGGHTITFSYTDTLAANGGPAALSSTSTLTDDTNFITITGPVGSHNNAVQNVTGTTDPYSTVTMLDPITAAVLSTNADLNGNYTFSNVTFPEGSTTYSCTSTDLAGNVASEVATVIIDTSNFITITSPIPGSVINTITNDIVGTTDPGATVTMTEPGTGALITTTADATGIYTFDDVAFVVGVNNLNLTSTDTLGNVATTNTAVTVDLSIILNISTITNSATYNISSHVVGGVTDPNSTLTMTHPTSGATLTTTADAAGNYSFGSFLFPDGLHTVTVNATDPPGNTATANVSFTVDTTNTNTIANSGTYTTPTVDITGTTDPLSTVTMTHPVNGQLYTTTATAAGIYTYYGVPFPDGTYTITTTSTDPLGNVAVDTAAFAVDATISLIVTNPPNNSVVTNPLVDLTGVTDPGSTVLVVSPATDVDITATADASGNFTLVGLTMNSGQNYMTVTSTDPAGNQTSVTHVIYYFQTISVSITSPRDGSVVKGNTQNVVGLTDPLVTVYMFHPTTNAQITTTADAAGNYSFNGLPFQNGYNTVTVYATTTDNLGNTLNANTSSTFIVAETGVDATLTASVRTVVGESIYIRVTDNESYLSTTVRDTVTVTVTDPTTGDSETLTLLETGVTTGVFTGYMRTVQQAVSDGANSGTLAVTVGDTVTTSFLDLIQADGTLDVTLTAQTRITNDAIQINVQATSIIGQVSTAPLVDHGVSILEFGSSGTLTGNVFSYQTDASGYIPAAFISMMCQSCSYSVLIEETYNGTPYSQSQFFGLTDLENLTPDANGVRTLIVVIDPSGFVYDAMTGDRVNGADVTLYHSDGTVAIGPFSFYTHLPSSRQTNSQLSGSAGYSGGFEFIGSTAGSDIAPGQYYVSVTFNTTPALANNYQTVTQSAGIWPGLGEPYTGQLFTVSSSNEPIGMRIPLLPVSTSQPISITKRSNKDFASVGDIVTFTVTVTNQSNVTTGPDYPVVIEDAMPTGFVYVDGSAVDSSGQALQITENGNTINFQIGRLYAAGDSRGRDSITIYYQAVVDTSVREGTYLQNRAVAQINNYTLSNEAFAVVRVTADPLMDLATLIGKVYSDDNGNGRQDRGETGVQGVGVAMDDGTYIVTDENGLFSAPGVTPGLDLTGYRAVKIDMATLPEGSVETGAVTQLVKLTPGGLGRANFGVRIPETEDKKGLIQSPADIDRTRGNLFIVMLDGAVAELKSGAGEANRPNSEVFTEGSFAQGRATAFFDGMVRVYSDLRLTAAYDSFKKYSYDMMTDRDRNQFLPTYGDSSRAYYLAESQGKLFIDAMNDVFHFRFGDYEARFEGTELSGVRRSLSGGLMELSSRRPDEDSVSKNRLMLFSSPDKQLHARTEFRSVGGTHYYLSHSNIAAGSESVMVETRSAIAPDYVISRRTLRRDDDYEVDYLSGRIRLFQPVGMYSESDLLNLEGIRGGDPVWIVVEYLYSPLRSDFGTFGARWRHKAYGKIGLGVSFLQENTGGNDHTLAGVDLHLEDMGLLEAVNLEYARSKEGGIAWYSSLDAGRTFSDLGALNADRGNALKGEVRLKLFDKIIWESYYYAIDPGFTGQSFGDRGIRRGGTTMSMTREKTQWQVDYTKAVTTAGAGLQAMENTAGGGSRAFRAMYKRCFRKAAITVEYLHTHVVHGYSPTNINRGTRDGLAVMYEKIMTDRIKLYTRQQVAMSSVRNHQTTLGVNYMMTEDGSFTAEGTIGSYGRGGRFGFEKNRENGSRYHADLTTGYSTEAGENRTGIGAGVSGPLSRDTEAFAEYSTENGPSDSLVRRTVGLSHNYYAGGDWHITMSAERSQEVSSTNGEYFTNAVSVISDYKLPIGGNFVAEGGYRRSSGTRAARQFNYRFQGDTKIDEEISVFAEYEYITSELVNTDTTESKYTKSLLGAAYRPKDNDRLNVLMKMGRTREMRGAAMNAVFNPDTTSTVLSLEGLYELSHEVTLHQKIASKLIMEKIPLIPKAKSHTTLWISGFNWKPGGGWDLDLQYRTRHQPTQLNNKDGFAIEAGYTYRNTLRLSIGYNFSSYTDNEFASDSYSYRGTFFGMQMVK